MIYIAHGGRRSPWYQKHQYAKLDTMLGRPLSIHLLLVSISMVACLEHINPSPDEATVFSLVVCFTVAFEAWIEGDD